ncbi:cathelicidin-related antimicrobial peptide Bf-CRAMP-like [Dendrobates tinctorius]|uniref:cathelicidin-related antimicrobial peptide Bf-CRAMP-like n=1 Tax=Dendrobates tinctorius TaxID=92724 RepID=UPI003CCA08DA
MMRSWRLSLLLVSAVTLHGCLSDTAEPGIKDGRSIGDITDLYNQKEGVTYLYKSLDQIHIAPPEEGEKSERRSFILKETACLKSENPDLSQCDFKPDGDVKICSVDLSDENPEDILCITQTKDVRVKRSSRKPWTKKRCPPGGCSVIGRKAQTQNGTEIDEKGRSPLVESDTALTSQE